MARGKNGCHRHGGVASLRAFNEYPWVTPAASMPTSGFAADLVQPNNGYDLLRKSTSLSQTTRSYGDGIVDRFVNPPSRAKRPNVPTQAGTPLPLVTNLFPVKLPSGKISQYTVSIYQIPGPTKPANGTDPDLAAPSEPRLGRGRLSLSAEINHKVVLICQRRIAGEYQLAYDGRQGLYTRRPLPFLTQEFSPVEVTCNKERLTFTVNVEYVADVDFDSVRKIYENIGRETVSSVTASVATLEAADVILRTGLTLSLTPVGRAFYRAPIVANKDFLLGGGLETWPGQCTSIRLGTWRPLVNLDIKCSAFYVSGPLLKLAKEVLDPRGTRPDPLKMPLSPRDREKLTSAFKGVLVYSKHLSQRRKIQIVGLTAGGADTETFDWNDKSLTVADYFREKYNITLERADLPCAILGKANGPMVPIELLTITPGQRCVKKLSELQTSLMMKRAATPPNARFQRIKDAATLLKATSERYCTEFDMTFESNNIVVQGRRLSEPAIDYRHTDSRAVKDGAWHVGPLLKPAQLDRWAIAVMGNVRGDTLAKMANTFGQASRSMGITMAEPYVQTFSPNASPRHVLTDIKRRVRDVQMTLVIMSPQVNYCRLKYEAETSDLCMRTQCVRESNVEKRFSLTFAQNVLQKMNAKLGGQNSCVRKDFRPPSLTDAFMVIGMDIKQSRPGEKAAPSIACLVASMDAIPAQYHSVTSLQRNEQWLIVSLKSMFVEALIAYRNANRYLPKRLIIFRGNVPDGQIDRVHLEELAALREACKAVRSDYRPPMAFIFVSKRHHVRFHCQNERQGVGKANNIPPGTLVDVDIVQPGVFGFYLCSHAGIQGTSCPAHYQVVHDDALQSPDEIYSICYFLCHTNMRCTRSVSMPAPLAYANLALQRARDYVKAVVVPTERKTWTDDEVASLANALSIPPAMRGVMYYI